QAPDNTDEASEYESASDLDKSQSNLVTDENDKENVSAEKVVDSQSEESEKTVSIEKSAERTPDPSIAKGPWSRTGKPVPSASEVAKTSKPTKKTNLKPVLYGPKRTWSKDVPTTEKKKKSLKRKEAPSNVATTGTSSRKSIGGKKVPLNVPSAPMDNVSFHHENSASRWKYVYNRRLALEKELGKDALECQEIVDLIGEAGLMKTVWGLGKCVEFSPTVINQFLGRSIEAEAEIGLCFEVCASGL
ncbi:envelope-like protein, partial [Trifolium medium]|nr:envelope-like protein [Trifolium medium]